MDAQPSDGQRRCEATYKAGTMQCARMAKWICGHVRYCTVHARSAGYALAMSKFEKAMEAFAQQLLDKGKARKRRR